VIPCRRALGVVVVNLRFQGGRKLALPRDYFFRWLYSGSVRACAGVPFFSGVAEKRLANDAKSSAPFDFQQRATFLQRANI
jgi:hypothetical protein